MTPEAEDYLAKARADLEDARKIITIPLPAVAARSAYYAAFHAAEALIIQRVGKIIKTHSGVHTEFARLFKDASNHDKKFVTFLAQAYKYKQICDYGIGQASFITDGEAAEAVANADGFVTRIAEWVQQG